MNYILLIIVFILIAGLHWHYYRWKVFNPWPANTPQIYRSNSGTLVLWISKILLFGAAGIFFNWYLVLVIFILFQILKFVAFKKAFAFEAKEFYVHLGSKVLGENKVTKEVIDSKLSKEKKDEIEREARETAKGAVFKFKNKKLSGSFLSKILYLIT